MPYKIIVTQEAQIDLDENFIWYEEQKENLGFDFINAFERTLDNIVNNPFYASLIDDDARSASLIRFPYAIIYRFLEEKQEVRILAIIHQNRNPQWISSRIK